MNSTEFYDLVSGRKRGVSSTLMRSALSVAEPIYSAAMAWRNWRFDAGHGVQRVPVPVISVGNITLGGTGKTPMVEWLARWFSEHGVRVALVSRGYGTQDARGNDESRELADRLPGVPHVLDRLRARGAQQAIQQHGAQLIILDDGFQHRAIARDLNLVLVDALEPFGFEHVFPRGTLREPLSGLARADVIALSRADAVDTAQRATIRQRISTYNAQTMWLEIAHRPRTWRNASSELRPLNAFAGRRVLAFCGLGNPAAFRLSLANCDCEVVEWREFPDHHPYTSSDLHELAGLAEKKKISTVVCTHKDLVKVTQTHLGSAELWALEISMEILEGHTAWEERLGLLAHQALRQAHEACSPSYDQTSSRGITT